MNSKGELSIRNVIILAGTLLLSGIYFTTVYPEITRAASGDLVFFQLIGLAIILVGIFAIVKKPSQTDAQLSGF